MKGRSERPRPCVFDAGAATREARRENDRSDCVSRRSNRRVVRHDERFDRASETTARFQPDLCETPTGRTPGAHDAQGVGSTREARLRLRGTFPRGRAQVNPVAVAKRATRPSPVRATESPKRRELQWGSGQGDADAPLSPHLSVASAVARRHLVHRGTERAYLRFSRARDVRCPPLPNPLSPDFNPRPRLPKFRGPWKPDTAPRDVRDRLDRSHVTSRVPPRPCDDARPSRAAFEECLEPSGARPDVTSRSFFQRHRPRLSVGSHRVFFVFRLGGIDPRI